MAAGETNAGEQPDTEIDEVETPQSSDEVSDAELDQVAGGKAH